MATSEERTLTVRDLVGGLKLGQLWALLTAAATVVGGAFGLGLKSQPMLSQDLKPCAEVAKYPLGTWIQSGRVTRAPTPDKLEVRVADEITFDEPRSGFVQTDEKGAKLGSFTVDRPLKPGEAVVISHKDSTGYASQLRGVVSPCGCFIKGQWDDTRGKQGYATMIWKRDRYWVKP